MSQHWPEGLETAPSLLVVSWGSCLPTAPQRTPWPPSWSPSMRVTAAPPLSPPIRLQCCSSSRTMAPFWRWATPCPVHGARLRIQATGSIACDHICPSLNDSMPVTVKVTCDCVSVSRTAWGCSPATETTGASSVWTCGSDDLLILVVILSHTSYCK